MYQTYDCQNKIYGNQAPLLNCQLLLARMLSDLGHRASWKMERISLGVPNTSSQTK
jgi:hypothetical protein